MKAIKIFGLISMFSLFGIALIGLISHFLPTAFETELARCIQILSPGRCTMTDEIDIGVATLKLTSLGIVASIVSTVALLITIFFSARATEAATQAAKAASDSLEHVEYYSSLEFRPYMVVDSLLKSYIMDAEGQPTKWRFDFRWKNAGKTPARRVISRTEFAIFDSGIPAGFSFPWREATMVPASAGPNMPFTSSTPYIEIETLEAVGRGDKQLHVYAWIEYQGFRPGERYRTEAHLQIWLLKDPRNPQEFTHSTGLAMGHNGMDEGCTKPIASSFSQSGPVTWNN